MASLESLLSLPSALQSLDITSRRSLHRRMKKVSLVSLIRILAVHQPKLESLTFANALDFENNDQIEDSEIKLSPLSKLKYLALPYDNGRQIQYLDNVMRYVSPNEGLVSLETVLIGLELRNGKASSALSGHRKLGFKRPHLRTLILALSVPKATSEREDSGTEGIRYREAFKKRLVEKGIKYRIIVQETIHHRYVPPYLFGEKAPERKTICDFSAEDVLAS